MIPQETLLELSQRIERLSTAPKEVRAPFTRLARPILRRLGWQPRPKIEATQRLIERFAALEGPPELVPSQEELGQLTRAALKEIAGNITAVERACVVNGRAPTAYVSWLWRLYETLRRAARAVGGADEASRRTARGMDPTTILPPLAVRAAPEAEGEGEGEGEARGEPGRDASRLVELELGAIDHLLAAARAEGEVLARRRRLLEAARQLLLEASAALPLDPAGVEARRRYTAREINRMDRLQAAGLSAEVGLLHQARTALAGNDRQRLYASLLALDELAASRGDSEVAALSSEALRRLTRGQELRSERARAQSLARSAEELLGPAVLEAVEEGYEAARRALPRTLTDLSADERMLVQAAREYTGRGAEAATLNAAIAVDGCFEVGGVLSPVRIFEEETRPALVRFPTQDLVLVPAEGVEDIKDAVIEDPRAILLSLATGRLLTRRFARQEPVRRSRTILRSEARVYLLDGSSSMLGPRARMRDALLVAELTTLERRLRELGRAGRVVLFYRYFTEALEQTTRVASPEDALAAIREVISTPRFGGTDIEQALVASFEQVRQARREDPDLGRAQLVLVTDGEAGVDEALIQQAREGLDDFPIAVSVIALGQENPALRALVARQRARGERAFYHFIDDEALEELTSGRQDPGPAVHLPPRLGRDEPLEELVGGLLDELAALGRKRDLEGMERLDLDAAARKELGLSERTLSEGEQARLQALYRDRRALGRRFDRWFPRPQPAPPQPETALALASELPAPAEREDLEATTVLLATVAEVIGITGGSELSRQADAIDLLERLLPDARLSPARYEATLRAFPAELAPGLAAVHQAISGQAQRRAS